MCSDSQGLERPEPLSFHLASLPTIQQLQGTPSLCLLRNHSCHPSEEN